MDNALICDFCLHCSWQKELTTILPPINHQPRPQVPMELRTPCSCNSELLPSVTISSCNSCKFIIDVNLVVLLMSNYPFLYGYGHSAHISVKPSHILMKDLFELLGNGSLQRVDSGSSQHSEINQQSSFKDKQFNRISWQRSPVTRRWWPLLNLKLKQLEQVTWQVVAPWALRGVLWLKAGICKKPCEMNILLVIQMLL